MAVQYRHTQTGTVSLVVIALTIAFVLCVFAWIGIAVPAARTGLMWTALAVLVLLAGVGWYLSSMTVEVTDDEVRWHFGPGRDWRIPRADIEGVSLAPHPWIGGYGIRWFGPQRWVYIVSGRNTVEIRLKQGGWRRLGTDDPQGLLRSLTPKGA